MACLIQCRGNESIQVNIDYLALEGLMNPLLSKGGISPEEDFNNILDYGIYTIYSSTQNNVNAPSTEISYGIILCYGHSRENERIAQVVIDVNSGIIYTRRNYNGWSNWRTV